MYRRAWTKPAASVGDYCNAVLNIYRVPEGPIETRHLKMYSDYLLGFKKEHEKVVTEKIIRATTLTGTAEEILESIEKMREAGISQVAIQPIVGNRETIDAVASEIISRLSG